MLLKKNNRTFKKITKIKLTNSANLLMLMDTNEQNQE